MEEIITKSAVKWEIIWLGMLTNDDKTSSYKVLSELQIGIRVGKISSTDTFSIIINISNNINKL